MKLFQKLFRKSAIREQNDNSVDLTRVYPRIKGIFDDEMPDPKPDPSQQVLEMSYAESPVYENFAKGIAIFYGIDTGYSYELVQNGHLSETITLEKLRAAALANMARDVSDKTQIDGDPANIMMLTNGGNFEATMILMEGVWENLEPVFNDQICIAIPARDLLFIAGRNNPVGMESLRAIIRKFFDERETQGLIVRHIYARENNQWILLETA